MRGFPRKIATRQDLYNCLALVQAGELSANDFSNAISAIEEREFISVPIREMSDDRKTVVINPCVEATEGKKVKNAQSTTILAVQTLESESMEGLEDGRATEVTLSRAIPEGSTILKISENNPYERLGITREDFNSIKGVLRNYE